MDMKSRLIIPTLFFLLIFSSCNTAMDKTYSSTTYVNDIAAIRESNEVPEEDVELLTKYIALNKIAGNSLEGRTYKDILEQVKSIKQTNNDKNEQEQMAKEAMRDRMSAYLSVSLSGKDFIKINNKDCFNYTVAFRNLSTKNIKMVVGGISLNDLLDREIKNIEIILDEQLHAGETLKEVYTVSYANSNENDKRIRSKELVDLRIVWNPSKIIFEDGTIAE